jgi:four helix bundle protein
VTGRDYTGLTAWQKAMDLVESVYDLTRAFPKDERFGLTAQLRKAAVSIPSNIAEGQGRRSRAEFLRFILIAYGSLREVETQVLIPERLSYVNHNAARSVLHSTGEVGRLVNGLARSLYQ